jgi:hypothetical protein
MERVNAGQQETTSRGIRFGWPDPMCRHYRHATWSLQGGEGDESPSSRRESPSRFGIPGKCIVRHGHDFPGDN